MQSILEDALVEQHKQARQAAGAQPRRRGRPRREDGGEDRERIDYASPEHAGMPHRGRTTEAEKHYVRVHLDEVNARRRAAGHPAIDPSDPKMQERYGFSPDQVA